METKDWNVLELKISVIMQMIKCPCPRFKRKKKENVLKDIEKVERVLESIIHPIENFVIRH